MNKFLLVSPHSDDALFSAFHTMVGLNYEVQVLTVENDPKRAAEDRQLYEFLEIPVHHLDLPGFVDTSYYHHFKERKFKHVSSDNAFQTLAECHSGAMLMVIEATIRSFVDDFLWRNPDYRILAPLGIGHPFHLFVRGIVKDYPRTLFYRDFPHSYKRRNKVQIEEARVLGFDLFKQYPVDEFHEVKWELARRFYRSQSSLLFYEQGYIDKRLPEEVWYFDDELPF